MNSKTYIDQAMKTDLSREQYEAMAQRSANPTFMELEHGAYGLVTEAGEFLDALKKHKYYNKPLDMVNLAEELGDIFWYCARIAKTLGVTFEEPQERNISKLIARYGDKFTEEKALNRDLKTERTILET